MAVFPSNPVNKTPMSQLLRKYPGLFGVPFVLLMVGASFMLTPFTQTRYDLQDQRVKQMNKADELRLDQKRKKFDIREEYFRLSAASDDEWESKRIKRPKGLPEWGVPPPESPNSPKDSGK
ncbi:Cytochrome oxidase assembly [Pleurotus ostreatus]|uniref:Cytochrome c oxidase assembly protein COX16, mitochondrial n=1 Tax=Pleurotus ostreatus TaxID=5322 RepID=A0A8H7A3Z3_PLEOS|nr:Cytochrome oxidase assembly [Pleurotus ostreatus]KAF7440334.1 Cytochrome oxidase assembly [Pleurotus ostreatus]KAJ8700359.1 Cytochrome oxidase assembly [Pleurotus ostreatus]